MLWFVVAVLGYACLGAALVLDKFILTKSVDKPAVFTFYSTIFLFLAVFLYPFGVEFLQTGLDWSLAVLSGVTFGGALWCMYEGVDRGRASEMNPFIGSILIIVTLVLSLLFLEEVFSAWQLIGVAILSISGALLTVDKKRGKFILDKGFWWALFAGVFFALSHVSAKYLYDNYDFLSVLVWTRASIGFVGIATLLHPDVQSLFKKKQKRDKKPKTQAQAYALGIVGVNKLLGVVGAVLVQYAIAIGSVTLVNAMVGIQYTFLFIIVYLLTKFAPRLFQERISRRELVVEIIALVLVLVGTALFVF